MALDIEQLRAAFKSKADDGNNSENVGFWQRFYPFYKMDFEQMATFRFLPDLDENNPLGFIVENKYHELIINGKKKKLACLKMYGESCPCCETSAKYYNEGDTKLGKVFWRKIDYIAQGVIVNSPFDYEIKEEENPVRLISISKQLYEKIESEIVNGDLDVMPYDMAAGYDFRIIKNKKIVPQEGGGNKEYGNYSDSSFARKSSPIKDSILNRIELLDLKSFRFVKIEKEAMEAMIEATLTGKSYDEGNNQQTSNDNLVTKQNSTTGSASLDVKVDTPKETTSAETVLQAVNGVSSEGETRKLSPQEILKKLKEKQGMNN